jgi:predicted DCC family thiol-disulfide oxidoreductase YuxK
MSTLYYDPACPICKQLVKSISHVVTRDRLSFVPISGDDSTFSFKADDGRTYYGNEAIGVMGKTFPELQNYFWMLPKSMRVSALKATASVAGVARKIYATAIKAKGGGCNCGR